MSDNAVREAAEALLSRVLAKCFNCPFCSVDKPKSWESGEHFDECVGVDLHSALVASSSPPKADGSRSRDAMIVEAVRLRSGYAEAEALRALLEAYTPTTSPVTAAREAFCEAARDAYRARAKVIRNGKSGFGPDEAEFTAAMTKAADAYEAWQAAEAATGKEPPR